MTFRELIEDVPESDYDLPVFISDRCGNCYRISYVMVNHIKSEEDWEKGKPASLDVGDRFIEIAC